MIALAVNFFAALSYGQEPAAQLLEDALAAFGVIAAPSQEESRNQSYIWGGTCFGTSDSRPTVKWRARHAMRPIPGELTPSDSHRMQRASLRSVTRKTVFNSMLQPYLRWTGDRKSGAHQAEKSLTGSMGFASVDDVMALLKQHGYESKFKKCIPFDRGFDESSQLCQSDRSLRGHA